MPDKLRIQFGSLPLMIFTAGDDEDFNDPEVGQVKETRKS
jgi:hypothetical protein